MLIAVPEEVKAGALGLGSKDGEINLIFNTTEGWQSLKDSEAIRRSALLGKIAQYTTAAGGVAAAQAIAALREHTLGGYGLTL